MELVITLDQLAWLIILVIIAAVGIYAAIALKNLNRLAQQINDMMEKNQENLNRIIPNVTRVSDDAAVISEDLRHTVGDAREALEVVTLSTREKVDRYSQTAENLSTYAIIGGEVAKVLIDVFSDRKRKK